MKPEKMNSQVTAFQEIVVLQMGWQQGGRRARQQREQAVRSRWMMGRLLSFCRRGDVLGACYLFVCCLMIFPAFQ